MLKKEEPRELNKVLEVLVKQWGIEDKYLEAQLVNDWEKFVGKPIANQTEKLYIKHDILIVTTHSGIAKKELNILKPALIHMINQKFNKSIIKDIKIF
jgi:predicted nucleic acid-binding Zn ribbon protein